MRFPFPLDAEIPLYLAPMAGVSESPFRRLCRRIGADVVVTEFLSAEGIRRENEATLHKLRVRRRRAADRRADLRRRSGRDGRGGALRLRRVPAGVHRHQLRLSGQEGREAQRRVRLPAGISISCSRSSAPSSSATHLPVTCKIRSGWNEEMRDPVQIALRCQDAGARVLALHPRTRTQMYTGTRGGRRSPPSSQALDIPVLGNGDIKTAEDAIRMHRADAGAPAIMIARGSFGQPWIFDQVKRSARRDARCGPRRRSRSGSPSRSITRAMVHGVRDRSARRGDRVPQAPRLVREGAATAAPSFASDCTP